MKQEFYGMVQKIANLSLTKTNLEPVVFVERTRKNLLKDINKNFNNSKYK